MIAGREPQFREQGTRKICRNVAASIGLMVWLQTALAALDSRVARSAPFHWDKASVGCSPEGLSLFQASAGRISRDRMMPV
ncbi:MAG: hypothetical protein E7813_21160 [Bradyrhizobium sp.]|uniref:hypothetical protein n=1 Tax=Bradyrhizobium sp. TaxID=376 RepID=UPI00121EDA98|nr:hypothetical protein [Bradyrhizobium sp.]THD61945.1 MAG: hypothetical protein E7813_21160 [Bradyrhizobium sp.]